MADETQTAPPSHTEIDALVASAVNAYALSHAAVQAFADAIYAARIATHGAAYTAAARELGAAIAEDGYQPTGSAAGNHQWRAVRAASGIAATYRRDLTASASGFIDGWLDAHNQSLAGCADALTADLGAWCDARAAWKVPQIVNAETGAAHDDGTAQAVDDALDGTLTDDAGETLDLSNAYATVLPDDAAEPFCGGYAGNTYDVDGAQDLFGLFPAHPNCDHQVYLFTD